MSTISASTTTTTAFRITTDTAGTLVFQTGSTPTTAVTIDASQRVAFVAGTAAAPAITTTGDTDTGIFFPAANTLAFSTNGTEDARFDSAGNLGLGVTPSAWGSPFKAFQFGSSGGSLNYRTDSNQAVELALNWFYDGTNSKYINSNWATRYRQFSGAHEWYTAASGTAGNNVTFTQAMTLDASGNLLVGATSTTQSHRIVGVTTNSWTTEFFNNYASLNYGVDIAYTAAAPNGTGNQFLRGRDSSATRFEFRSNGGLANYSGNNANLSDRREKTNFAPAGDYLAKICAIPVQTFNYIDQNLEEDDGLTLGVVAQDVQAVAPELVTESNWGTEEEPKMRLSIYQTDLQYALMKAIQEQQAIIEQMQTRLTALEGAA